MMNIIWACHINFDNPNPLTSKGLIPLLNINICLLFLSKCVGIHDESTTIINIFKMYIWIATLSPSWRSSKNCSTLSFNHN